MRSRSLYRSFVFILLNVACVCGNAQNSAGESGPSSSALSPVSVALGAVTWLDTGSIIALGQSPGPASTNVGSASAVNLEPGAELLYGGRLSAVYLQDFNLSSVQHVTTGLISPLVGVYLPTHTGSVSLQYQGDYEPDDSFGNDFEAFHALSFLATGTFTRRWVWSVSNSTEYGAASVAFERSLPTEQESVVPVVDSLEPADFLIGRNVTFLSSSAGIGWRASNRDAITLTAYHFYSNITSSPLAGGQPGAHYDAVGGKIDYSHEVTRRLRFDLYAQEEHLLQNGCDLYGGGAGITGRLSNSLLLELSGGPEWSSPQCYNKAYGNFYGALIKTWQRRAQARPQAYILGWQYYTQTLQATNTWETAVAAGFVLPLTAKFSVEATAGYFRGNPLLDSNTSLKGYFIAPRVVYKFNQDVWATAGYRLFVPTAGSLPTGNLSFVMASVEYHPKPFQFAR